MGQPRLLLHSLLEEAAGEGKKVYFQPPANVQMTYPCIVYNRDNAETEFAGNKPYYRFVRYQVTVIDQDPDSAIPEKVADLPMCLFERHFTAGNLHHDVFNIYF